MKIRTAFVFGFFVATLSACSTNPIPSGYSGPLAKIKDSATAADGKRANFFYLEKIDGNQIHNSLIGTRVANYGRGMQMTPIVIERDVPARSGTYTIVGKTEHAAPILSILNTEYEIAGDIQFSPAPQGSYVVKGVLGEGYSAVWMEDVATGAVIDKKIEINGSATRPFMGR